MANNGSIAILVLAFCFFSFVDNSTAEWLNHGGGDLSNRRSEIGGIINPISVRLGLLRQRWKFLAGFDITATPSVANGVIYFPSWNGNLYAVNAANGALIWQRNIGQLTGLPPPGTFVNVTVSRATPVVADDLLIVGIYGPAYVIAVTRSAGTLVWSTRLDPAPWALLRHLERFIEGGYAGAGIWGSSLSIDMRRGLVYAMDARTGAITWTFETGATVYGGASSSYGCIFIGHGYSIGLAKFHPTWTSGKYLFALCIP
ncbi:hypothetical protein SASPL_110521 [Salvia splendens]|uniref:Pyrrolo-quinoline quinone repeat domain-containing protein n=1 Tax=Salvia splendens TaxID=180675 RepID=A0A8X9A4A5_SALSN|nr:hypothetical protein SASPL_110521 [Salvia splendens]